jgi:hypothetical protein
MSNDEVQDLIKELTNLRLQQTELLARLERARGNEARAGVYDKKNPAPENSRSATRCGSRTQLVFKLTRDSLQRLDSAV